MPLVATSSVSSIYIASSEGGTGKSTIALGLLHPLGEIVAAYHELAR